MEHSTRHLKCNSFGAEYSYTRYTQFNSRSLGNATPSHRCTLTLDSRWIPARSTRTPLPDCVHMFADVGFLHVGGAAFPLMMTWDFVRWSVWDDRCALKELGRCRDRGGRREQRRGSKEARRHWKHGQVWVGGLLLAI